MELESLKNTVAFEVMRGSMKKGSAGLGHGTKFRRAMSAEKEERQAILRVFKETQEEKRVTEVMTNLKHFGEWVKWDAVQQLDRKWHSLLAYECDSQLQFLLNATEDTLPTPSNLFRWGGKADPQCPLGCHCVGSLRHILNACCRGEEKHNGKEGMEGQWRVTWRHDSVLLAISKAVLKVINRFKNTQAEAKRGRHPEPPGAIIFKNTEGKTYQHPAVRAPEVKNLFAKAMDWKIMFDLGVGKTQFPAEIIETNGGVGSRPDGVIWSMSTKVVVWIELTCPWEDNMSKWHFRKNAKYSQLKINCEAKGWKVHPLCVEVGCRGYVAESFHRMCKVLGFTKKEQQALKLDVEKTAKHCSHYIFWHRYQTHLEPKPPLDVSKWSAPIDVSWSA